MKNLIYSLIGLFLFSCGDDSNPASGGTGGTGGAISASNLAGEWTMVSQTTVGVISDDCLDAVGCSDWSSNATYSNGTCTYNQTTYASEGSYTNYTFNSDGTFSSSENWDGNEYSNSGTYVISGDAITFTELGGDPANNDIYTMEVSISGTTITGIIDMSNEVGPGGCPIVASATYTYTLTPASDDNGGGGSGGGALSDYAGTWKLTEHGRYENADCSGAVTDILSQIVEFDKDFSENGTWVATGPAGYTFDSYCSDPSGSFYDNACHGIFALYGNGIEILPQAYAQFAGMGFDNIFLYIPNSEVTTLTSTYTEQNGFTQEMECKYKVLTKQD